MRDRVYQNPHPRPLPRLNVGEGTGKRSRLLLRGRTEQRRRRVEFWIGREPRGPVAGRAIQTEVAIAEACGAAGAADRAVGTFMLAAAFGVALCRVAAARNTASRRAYVTKFEQEIREGRGRITFAGAGGLRCEHRLHESAPRL